MRSKLGFLAVGIVVGLLSVAAASTEFHVIHVVDGQTGRGVPLAELCTTSDICFVTDSNGIIALNEPSFWNRSIYFQVHSHGYSHPLDSLATRHGQSAC